MEYDAIQYSTNAILCNGVQYYAIQLTTVQSSAMQYSSMQYSINTMQLSTIQFKWVQYNAVQCNAVQCNTNTTKHNTMQYITVVFVLAAKVIYTSSRNRANISHDIYHFVCHPYYLRSVTDHITFTFIFLINFYISLFEFYNIHFTWMFLCCCF